jgi:hypothetical protein
VFTPVSGALLVGALDAVPASAFEPTSAEPTLPVVVSACRVRRASNSPDTVPAERYCPTGSVSTPNATGDARSRVGPQ